MTFVGVCPSMSCRWCRTTVLYRRRVGAGGQSVVLDLRECHGNLPGLIEVGLHLVERLRVKVDNADGKVIEVTLKKEEIFFVLVGFTGKRNNKNYTLSDAGLCLVKMK